MAHLSLASMAARARAAGVGMYLSSAGVQPSSPAAVWAFLEKASASSSGLTGPISTSGPATSRGLYAATKAATTSGGP
eukprot:2586124-Alexandrium_andersonii.AAC.1